MSRHIYPAMDLKDGKVVRLEQGDFNKETVYHNDPIQVAKKFFKLGITWLHLVNLDGALSGKFFETKNAIIIIEILKIAKKYQVKVQLGGGIRNKSIASELIALGLDRVIIGSLAIEQPEEVYKLNKIYPNKIAVSFDVFEEQIKIQGWTKESNTSIFSIFKEFENNGIKYFVITDISKDGMGKGVNMELYKKINKIKSKESYIIISGGISSVVDIQNSFSFGSGVIIGRSLYNGAISSIELENLVVNLTKTNLCHRIIPCLDVKDGRVVKGTKFKNLQDVGDPVEMARYYDDQGADELVFLDISATIENRKSMISIIKNIAENIFIPFSVGGGIRTIEDMTEIIKAGAEKVCINSAAIKTPELITDGAIKFGSQCIVVAIDAKREEDSWNIYTHGGTKKTGINAIEWAIKAVSMGAGELLVTSMDQDGTKEGYDLDLIREISTKVSVPIIASGGAGKLNHFKDAIGSGASAVLAASLFHYNSMNIIELKNYLKKNNLKIRLD